MTKQDKRALRRMVENHDDWSDDQIARHIGCHPSTVRKYRQVFGPKSAKPLATMGDQNDG